MLRKSLIALLSLVLFAGVAQADEGLWKTKFKDAHEKAQKAKKPILIKFSTTW